MRRVSSSPVVSLIYLCRKMCVLVLGFRSAGALGPMHKKYLRRVAAFVDGITRNTSMMNRLADLVITSYIGSTLVMMGAKCSSSSLNVRHRGMIMEHCSFYAWMPSPYTFYSIT